MNTGWKKWDQFLSKFANMKTPIHVLEIGSYEGDSASWFLDNLLHNPKSTITCVDTWEGSPEYVNINFQTVEQKFDERIKKNPRGKQLTKIKKLSYDGLIQLNVQKKEFHVVFIDASHEARDVIGDAVLSWRLLSKGGVMIFDDYQWKKLKPDYFTPRPAIDAFIHVMKPELKVLGIFYQAFVEKLMTFEKPVRATAGKSKKKKSK